jgi:hypothetical protein
MPRGSAGLDPASGSQPMNELPAKRPYGWMWLEGASDRLDEREWEAWQTLWSDQEKWFKSDTFQRYPSREQIHALGPDAVLGGWTPAQPIILPDTRVIAMGSCFAANFAEWLAAHGYNQALADPAKALLRNPFENIAVIAQQFRWAFGELDPETLFWIGKDKQRIFATEEKRLAIRQLLLDADVLIVTLALSELWYDTTTGEPLWRVAPLKLHDPARHAFKVLSCGETIAAFNQIERIRAEHLPKLKIVYTVSPLNMAATFRPVSALTANSASKAIVRAALDEFLRSRPDDLNKVYFYYPGFEIVTALLRNPFRPDNHHLFNYAIDISLATFAKAYTTIQTAAYPEGGTPAWAESVEGSTRLAELMRENSELQMHCDERLKIITRLSKQKAEELKIRPLLKLLASRIGRLIRDKISPGRSIGRP